MPFREVLDPEHLAILADVLDDACLAAGIPPESPDREDVAAMVMQFYSRGFRSSADLKAKLQSAIQRER